MGRLAIYLLIFFVCLFSLSACQGLVVSSEDCDVDGAGCDIGGDDDISDLFNACTNAYPKQYTLSVRQVDNGLLTQSGLNAPDNPAILDVGLVYGQPGAEALTRLNLDFVSDATDTTVGPDPDVFALTLELILLDLSQTSSFLTDYVANEMVFDMGGVWVGNRLARWGDPLALFDGLLNLNETYILQSCLGVLLDPVSGLPVQAISQPLYIQARLTGT